MTKNYLKNYLINLNLDQELKDLLLELVEGAPEVNNVLLNTIADILEQQGDFYNQVADAMEVEAQEYEDLAVNLELLDNEEVKARLEALQENQQSLITEINKKVEELKQTMSEQESTEEVAPIAVPVASPEVSQPQEMQETNETGMEEPQPSTDSHDYDSNPF